MFAHPSPSVCTVCTYVGCRSSFHVPSHLVRSASLVDARPSRFLRSSAVVHGLGGVSGQWARGCRMRSSAPGWHVESRGGHLAAEHFDLRPTTYTASRCNTYSPAPSHLGHRACESRRASERRRPDAARFDGAACSERLCRMESVPRDWALSGEVSDVAMSISCRFLEGEDQP